MKAIMGCDRAGLLPGDQVQDARGVVRMVILREVTLEEARESWERSGDGSQFMPVGAEHFYEVEHQFSDQVMN
jgi:hypothetical protein